MPIPRREPPWQSTQRGKVRHPFHHPWVGAVHSEHWTSGCHRGCPRRLDALLGLIWHEGRMMHFLHWSNQGTSGHEWEWEVETRICQLRCLWSFVILSPISLVSYLIVYLLSMADILSLLCTCMYIILHMFYYTYWMYILCTFNLHALLHMYTTTYTTLDYMYILLLTHALCSIHSSNPSKQIN